MEPVVIGLFGPQRSGKNTVVDHLVHVYRFQPHSISERMKDLAHALADREWGDDDKDRRSFDLNGHMPRDLYVHIGLLERFLPTVWIDPVVDKIRKSSHKCHVIESVGTQQQWYHIARQLTGYRLILVEVIRPGFTYKDNREPITDFDTSWRLVNDKDIGTFQHKVDRLVTDLRTDAVSVSPRPMLTSMFMSDITGRPHQRGLVVTV